jgi:transcriptional regulator of acetoin/glycerol metabolism
VTLREARYEAVRAYLYRLLSETGGNMRKAAKIAGVHRVTIYKEFKKHGIQVENRKYVRMVTQIGTDRTQLT